MFMDEIRVGDRSRSYKFYLRFERAGRTNTGPMIISGWVKEKGPDFLRVKASVGYREYTDFLIPFHAILYATERVTNHQYGE